MDNSLIMKTNVESNTENKYNLYLNVIGGHSIIIKCKTSGKLIKTTSLIENCIYNKLNNMLNDNYIESDFIDILPKIYLFEGLKDTDNAVINNMIDKKNETNNNLYLYSKNNINNFVSQCTYTIGKFILDKSLTYNDIALEEDKSFEEKYIKITNCKELSLFKINKELYNDLNLMSKSKLNWILFWWIKWHKLFYTSNLNMMEDLTHNMELPLIFDFKLGNAAKIGKEEHNKLKLKNSTSETLFFRLMGAQYLDKETNSLNIINKYQARKLNENKITDIIKSKMLLMDYPSIIIHKDFHKVYVDYIIEKLKSIKSIICKYCNIIELFSNSILILVDYVNIKNYCDSLNDKKDTSNKDKHKKFIIDNNLINIKLIDMGHTKINEINKDISLSFKNPENCYCIEESNKNYTVINGINNLIYIVNSV